MKKRFLSTLLTCLFAAGAMLLSSCGDDDVSIYVPEHKAEFELTDVSERRVFVIDPWQGKEFAIPLRVERNPDFEFSGKYFDWSIRPGADCQYLVLTLKADVERKPFMEKVKVRGLFSETKADESTDNYLYLVARNDEMKAKADVPTYQRMVGQSIILTGEMLPNPTTPMLDFDLLYNAGLVNSIANPEGRGDEATGMRYTETNKKMTETLGIDLKIPGSSGNKSKTKGLVFGGSFSQTFTKEEMNSDKYEYQIDIYLKTMMELNLATSLGNENVGPEQYLPYLSDEAGNLLNDPNHQLYKAYPNTQEGIYKLYDDYGTHFLTGGVYGGSFIYLYGRKQSCSFKSTSNAASASLSVKKPDTESGANWMESYMKAMNAQGGTLSGEGGDYSSEEEDVTKAKHRFIVRGGNPSNDFDVWTASITNENSGLALVSYGKSGTNQGSYLTPLYYLSMDPARRKAMEAHLENYLIARAAAPKEESKLIVADMLMQVADNGHVAEVKEKILVGPDGKKRIYQPLVVNNKYHDPKLQGFMLDTSSDDFLVVNDSKDQLWWVALDFENECKGINHIAFMTAKDAQKYGYTTRGNDAETGMNWGAINNNYVCLKFAKDNEPVITGVGIQHKYDKLYQIIATSAGTDMTLPFTDDTQFASYWTNNYTVGLPPGNTITETNSWFGGNSALNHGNWLHPVFTYKPLTRPIKFAKATPWQ